MDAGSSRGLRSQELLVHQPATQEGKGFLQIHYGHSGAGCNQLVKWATGGLLADQVNLGIEDTTSQRKAVNLFENLPLDEDPVV